jgi:hypothetical protein
VIEITSSPRKPSYKSTEGPPTVAFPIPRHPAPLGLRSLLPELKTPQARLDFIFCGLYGSAASAARCALMVVTRRCQAPFTGATTPIRKQKRPCNSDFKRRAALSKKLGSRFRRLTVGDGTGLTTTAQFVLASGYPVVTVQTVRQRGP